MTAPVLDHELDVDLSADWELALHLLVVRSGQRCEARTPACLAGPRGHLGRLYRSQVSIHHRRPRQMGGSRTADVHTLANLMLLCGSGTAGCHGEVERQRTVAERRGLLVRRGVRSPADSPLVLPGGRLVLLDPISPVYVNRGRQDEYDLAAPGWS